MIASATRRSIAPTTVGTRKYAGIRVTKDQEVAEHTVPTKRRSRLVDQGNAGVRGDSHVHRDVPAQAQRPTAEERCDGKYHAEAPRQHRSRECEENGH